MENRVLVESLEMSLNYLVLKISEVVLKELSYKALWKPFMNQLLKFLTTKEKDHQD